MDIHINGEEPATDKYEKYGKYSVYLVLLNLVINPLSLLWFFGSSVLWTIILLPVVLIVIAFFLGLISRNTDEGKIGTFSSIIIIVAYAIFILILLNPPFY